jgi:DNA polymerase (family 10)
VPLGEARAEAARLLGRLERNASALRLAVAGEARRMAPWVTRLDLLATAHEAEPLLDALATATRVAAVLERGADSILLRLASGLEVCLEVRLDEADAVPALVRATGPAAHVALLEARATALGIAWKGDALRLAGERLTLFEEADLYEALGLEPLAPELRDTLAPGAHIEALLSMADVRGIAGLHGKPGRGRYPLGEMAARAEREGYAWSLHVVPAEDEAARAEAERARLAWNDAPETQAPARLALEADDPSLLPPRSGPDAPWRLGALDLGDPPAPAALARAVDLLDHVDALVLRFAPTAALPPAPPDLLPLLRALAARRVALAVVPPPHHARPEPELLAHALALGVPLLLLADAKDLVGVDDLTLCVGLARRAGAGAPQVLNTLPLAELDLWLTARREPTA